MSVQTIRLCQVADFIRGVTFDKSQQQNVATHTNIPVLRAGNIQNELDTQSDLIFVSREVVSDAQFMRAGDIAICLSSGSPQIVGKSAALTSEWRGTVGGFCGIIRPRTIEPEFLALWLRGSEYIAWRDEQARGANIQNLRFSELGELELQIPKPDIQRQIATRLKAQLAEVETARKAAQTQLQDSRLLRSRLLKQFFATLDVGPKKKLGDCAATTSGSTPSRSEKRYWQPADIAWVKTGEVAFAPITATEEAITKAALSECSLSLLPPKTILIAMYGQGKTRGQSAILEIPATTNQACFAVLPNATWEPDFLFLWLQASYQDLRDLSDDRGGNQANLNGALLNALEVPAPSKTEQQALVLRIQAAMAEVDAIEASAKAALADIECLPSRVLAQAFNPQGDHHGR